MERRPTVSDTEIAGWLSAPGGEPPFEIVTRVVARTGRMRQRPSAIVTLLGVPSAGRRETALPPSRQIALVLVAAALIVTIVGIAVGSGRTDQVPRPSAFASQPVSSAPPTTRPTLSVEPPEIPPPPVPGVVALDGLGLHVRVADLASVSTAADRMTADGYLVTVGDRSTGAELDVGPGRPRTRVWGADLGSIMSMIAALPNVSIDDIGSVPIDTEVGRLVWLRSSAAANAHDVVRRWPLAIVLHRGRLYLARPITSRLWDFPVDSSLRSFTAQIDFIDPTTVEGDGFKLTMPDSWHATVRGSFMTVVQSGPSTFGTIGYDLGWHALGSTITVSRGRQVDPASIAGRTLGELSASIEAAVPGAAEGRKAIRVDGARGYRFTVTQATTDQPLAALAVVVIGDRILLISQRLPLDGPPDLEAFDRLLDGLRFER